MDILEWFRGNARLKRWMFFIALGVSIMCFATAQLIGLNVIDAFEVLVIVLEFIAGLIMVLFGIVSIQKRTLEIFIEANGVSTGELKDKNIKLDSLIFDKTIYENGPKVVVIGAGSGVNSIIKGLRKYTSNITVVVTLSDTNKTDINIQNSRRKLHLLPYGSIKQSISSLSNDDGTMKKVLNHEFTSEVLEGLNFGDIYLLAMQEIFGNVSTSIKKSTEVLNIKGEVVPVSLDEITVCAELIDGSIVRTKEEIPRVVREKKEPIQRVYIEPNNARPTPRVLEAITDADVIVVAPGNLYTEIIPNILVKNIATSIKKSDAKKIYIANIMTDEGQTDEYNLSDHIKAITEHLGENIFDYCLADNGNIMPEYIRMYHKKGTDLVNIDKEVVKKQGTKVIQKDFSKIVEGKIRHDSEAIALEIMRLVLADIRYGGSDKKLMTLALEAVLKEQRGMYLKREKQLKKAEKKANKKINKLRKKLRKQGLSEKEIDTYTYNSNVAKEDFIEQISNVENEPSKFSEKYTQRIHTIREIDGQNSIEEKEMYENFFKKTRNIDNTEKEGIKQEEKEIKEEAKDAELENKINHFNTISIHNLVENVNKIKYGEDAELVEKIIKPKAVIDEEKLEKIKKEQEKQRKLEEAKRLKEEKSKEKEKEKLKEEVKTSIGRGIRKVIGMKINLEEEVEKAETKRKSKKKEEALEEEKVEKPKRRTKKQIEKDVAQELMSELQKLEKLREERRNM